MLNKQFVVLVGCIVDSQVTRITEGTYTVPNKQFVVLVACIVDSQVMRITEGTYTLSRQPAIPACFAATSSYAPFPTLSRQLLKLTTDILTNTKHRTVSLRQQS